MAASLSPQLVRLKQWMSLSVLLYGGAGLVFAVLPGVTLDIVHVSTRLLGLPDTPEPTERFWLTLAVSMMVMLVVCCVMVARDVEKNLAFCVPVFVSKFTSTLMGLLYFAVGPHHGALLAVGLTDFPLGVVTVLLWMQARRAA